MRRLFVLGLLMVVMVVISAGQTDIPGHLTVSPDQTNNLDACVRLMSLAGGNTVGVCAPSSLAGSYTVKMPGSNSAGALTNDGSGVLSWSSSNGAPFSDAAALVKNNADATKLAVFSAASITTATTRTYTLPDTNTVLAGKDLDNSFSVTQTFSGRINLGTSGASGPGIRDNMGVLECTDDGSTWLACGPSSVTNYWSRTGTTITTATTGDVLKLGSHLLFSVPSASDIGDATNYVQTIYTENIDAAPNGVIGNYTKVRKLEIADDSGGSGKWDFQVDQVGAVSSIYYIRDNAGTVVHRLVQLESVSAVNQAQFMFHLVPGNGSTTADNTYDIGVNYRRWRDAWFGGEIHTNNLTVTGTCTGCGSSSLPVTDTTGISKGSSDATKIVRFEVDGFTTGTTRVLTPPDADITVAGINLAQTWTATQTFQHIQFPSASNYDIGTSSNYFQTAYGENADLAPSGLIGNYTKVRKLEVTDDGGGTTFWDVQSKAAGGAVGSFFYVRDNAGTQHMRLVPVEIGGSAIQQAQFNLSLVPGNNATNADNTYDLGSSARSWRTLYIDTSLIHNGTTRIDSGGNAAFVNLTVSGTCTGCSGGYSTIQEDGSGITQRNTLNFIGASLTAEDGGTKTNVTLSQSPSGSTSVVGTGRTISTSSPLSGGGDLSADRTLSCSDCATLSTTQTLTGQKTFTSAAFFTNTVQVSSTLGTASILPLANNLYDIGAGFANNVRSIYFGTSLNQGFVSRIDSSGNFNADSYQRNGVTVIDSNRRGIFYNVNVTNSLISTPASGYTFYVNGSQVRVRFSDGTDKEVSLL